MTRINATIPPSALCDQHLVAEYREILRTIALATKKPVIESRLPKQFTLGTGHVLFFYNKLKYIHLRFNALRDELLRRRFEVNMEYDSTKVIGNEHLYNDWAGTDEANELVIDRLYERALTMKRITHYGISITADQYHLRLTNCITLCMKY